MKKNLHQVAAFVVCVVFADLAHGTPLYIRGSSDTDRLKHDGTVVRSFKTTFEVWVNNEEWLMRVTDVRSQQYEEIGCDGINVYSYLFDPRGILFI
jgi:hypothetical protein